MGETTKIAWTDSTFCPWIGCEPVSPGCANCYATRTWARLGLKPGERRRTSLAYWRQPLKWNRRLTCDCGMVQIDPDDNQTLPCPQCGSQYRPRRAFCGSLCDWLDDKVPIEWLAELLDLIRRTPYLDWLMLTKRPENLEVRMWICHDYEAWHGRFSTADFIARWLNNIAPKHVWIGVTAENQEQWDKRVPELLKIPAKIRFVSVEPMLEKINMEGLLGEYDDSDEDKIKRGRLVSWAIIGGESGPRARPCNVEWIRDGLRQCREANVPVFIKQLGSNPIQGTLPPIMDAAIDNDSKWSNPLQWPIDLRVQEWPVSEWRVD